MEGEASFADERFVIGKLLECTDNELRKMFDMNIDGDVCIFRVKGTSENYVSIRKSEQIANADFGFCRPAGYNNYPDLLTLREHLLSAFNASIGD